MSLANCILIVPPEEKAVIDKGMGQEGRSIMDIDWDSHNCSTGVIDTVDLSAKELENYQRRAAWEFYLRPEILLALITRMSFKQIVTIMMTRFFKKRFNIIYRMIHSLVRRRGGARK